VEALNVRERLEQCGRFGDYFFHLRGTVPVAVSAAFHGFLKAKRPPPDGFAVANLSLQSLLKIISMSAAKRGRIVHIAFI
jgi:hypothetical protein